MTKQEVWQAAKQSELDEFISKVAAAFPDAIDGVIIINSGGRYEYKKPYGGAGSGNAGVVHKKLKV